MSSTSSYEPRFAVIFLRSMYLVTYSKTLLCVSVLLSLSLELHSQQTELRGLVLDDSTLRPIRGVTVLLRRMSDSSLIQGVRSAANGSFAFRHNAEKNVFLSTQRLGYAAKHYRPTAASFRSQGDTLLLHAVDIRTADVEVSAWRDFQEISADKKSYLLSDNPTVTGTNVSEVLDQIPSVQVDENGAVYLRGDANVQIMIDDRPLKMDTEQRNRFLQQLSASDVEKIEVRSTPGARFDARSTAGIINIVSKRSVRDFLGANVSANASTNGQGGASLTLLYSDSLFNGSMMIGMNRWEENNHSEHERATPQDPLIARMHKSVDYQNVDDTYYVRPQVDVKISPKDILSFSSTMNYSPSDYSALGYGHRFGLKGDTLNVIRDTADGSQRSAWLDYSLIYRRSIDSSSSLRLGLSYTRFAPLHDDYNVSTMFARDSVLPELSFRQRIHQHNSAPTAEATLDYTGRPLDYCNLEAGLKYSSELRNNFYDTKSWDFGRSEFDVDSNATTDTHTFVKVAAAYCTAAWNLGSEWMLSTGLRLESASIGNADVLQPIEHRYTSLFPDLSLAYIVSDNLQLTIAMNRRVQLPEVEDLNPRLLRYSSTYTLVGNPDLKPQFTNAYEIQCSAQLGSIALVLNPFMRRTVDVIRSSGYLDGAVIVNTTKNFGPEQTLGSDFTISFRDKNGLNVRYGMTVSRYWNDGSEVSGDVPIQSNFFSGNLTLSYQFSTAYSLTANARYTAEYKTSSELVGDFLGSSLKFTAKPWSKDFSLSLNLNDPFDQQRRLRTKMGEGYILSSESKNHTRYVQLSLSYSFGHHDVRLEQHQLH